MKEKFANRLNQLMKENDVKAVDLSRSTGISEGVISQYRSGKYEPKLNRVAIFADYFGVSQGWLIGYSDDRTVPNNEREATGSPQRRERFLTVMEKRGITFEQLSRKTQVPADALRSLFEKGSDSLWPYDEDLILESLDTSYSYLSGGEDLSFSEEREKWHIQNELIEKIEKSLPLASLHDIKNFISLMTCSPDDYDLVSKLLIRYKVLLQNNE